MVITLTSLLRVLGAAGFCPELVQVPSVRLCLAACRAQVAQHLLRDLSPGCAWCSQTGWGGPGEVCRWMGLPGVLSIQITQHVLDWKPFAQFACTHSLLLVSNVLLLFLLPNSPKSLVQGTIPTNLPTEMPQLIPVFPGGTPLLPPVVTASIPVSTPLPPASFGLVMDPTKQLSSSSVLDAFEPPPGGSGGSTLDSLDSLDLLPYTDSRLDALDSFGTSRGSLDALDSFAIGRCGVTGFCAVLPGKACQGCFLQC